MECFPGVGKFLSLEKELELRLHLAWITLFTTVWIDVVSAIEATRLLIMLAYPCISLPLNAYVLCMGLGAIGSLFWGTCWGQTSVVCLFGVAPTHPGTVAMLGFVCSATMMHCLCGLPACIVLATSRAWIQVPYFLMGLGKMPLGSSGGEGEP